MEKLTPHGIYEILGKTIRWEAKGERRTYSGIAHIYGTIATHSPIIAVTLEGDMLSSAHINDRIIAPHTGEDLGLAYIEDKASIFFEIVKP